MKKLLAIGLILSLSIGSTQAAAFGGFQQPGAATKGQLEKVLKQAQVDAKKAAAQVKRLQRDLKTNPAARPLLRSAQAAKRRADNLVTIYENQLQTRFAVK